jgi:hypothetical protein
MPENDPQAVTTPVHTGFGDLQPAAQPVQVEVVSAPDTTADRAAVRAAAAAEERLQVERLERSQEVPVDLRSEAAKINDMIHKRIIEARLQAREDEKPKPPQPVTKHIMEQTQREMQEGARQSKWHADQREAALANKRPPVPRSPSMSPISIPQGTTAVFRPDDYIPDQVKKQGYTT